MRILHLAKYYWPRSGGMERVVQGLAEGAAALGHQVEVVAVESSGKAGSAGRLFGAVTSKEIAAAIKQQCKVDIDRRKIVMDSDIKAFGVYTIEIKLHPGIVAKMIVEVGEQG
jgi:large subunit ribosomal protein L9